MTLSLGPWPNTPPQPISLQNTIPAYPFEQYADDPAIQAFFAAYNALAQEYVAWFNSINLPVYTGAQISGPLLDWVGAGLYGMARPTLPYGQATRIGAIDTYTLDGIALNAGAVLSSGGVYSTTDDIYKRILTWHLYAGDGKVFNIRWLKRRIMRFLYGVNGTDCIIDQTYQVSVSFSSGHTVNITFTGPQPAANVLVAAINSGAVEMPPQYTYVVTG